MTQAKHFVSCVVRAAAQPLLFAIIFFTATMTSAPGAQAQQPQSSPETRIVVIGEGSVTVTPDYAHLTSGVTTTAKTVKEAIDASSKLMTAITAALVASGIAQKDIQTARFSVQPVFAHEPRTEPRLTGYRVVNQVSVTIRQISKTAEIIDRLATAGVTDIGSVSFLVSDTSKAVDQAREAAVVDARRKAEIYARASGVRLGQVKWITEDLGFALDDFRFKGTLLSASVSVPLSTGEDTLRAKITVGFEIER